MIFDWIADIFETSSKHIDEWFTTDEERDKMRNEFARIKNAVSIKVLALEKQLLTAQTKIITAEAQGQSWLQRSWRPITMLTFLILVVLDSGGHLANPLAPEAWTLLQIGIGGYVVGRSVEKIAPKVIDTLNQNNGRV